MLGLVVVTKKSVLGVEACGGEREKGAEAI